MRVNRKFIELCTVTLKSPVNKNEHVLHKYTALMILVGLVYNEASCFIQVVQAVVYSVSSQELYQAVQYFGYVVSVIANFVVTYAYLFKRQNLGWMVLNNKVVIYLFLVWSTVSMLAVSLS